jgi:hypothetical protein
MRSALIAALVCHSDRGSSSHGAKIDQPTDDEASEKE